MHHELLMTLALLVFPLTVASAKTFVPLDVRFLPDGADGVRSWVFSAAKKGDDRSSVTPVMANGEPGVRITAGERRVNLFHKSAIAAEAGRRYEISAKVRGSGQCSVGFFMYGAKWAWKGSTGTLEAPAPPSANEMKTIRTTLTVPDGVESIRPTLSAAPGSDVLFCAVELLRL